MTAESQASSKMGSLLLLTARVMHSHAGAWERETITNTVISNRLGYQISLQQTAFSQKLFRKLRVPG